MLNSFLDYLMFNVIITSFQNFELLLGIKEELSYGLHVTLKFACHSQVVVLAIMVIRQFPIKFPISCHKHCSYSEMAHSLNN